MNKRTTKIIFIRIAGVLIALLILAGALSSCTSLLERKDSQEKYEKFFEHASDMDVLFFGTSHVLNSIFPMELWHDYGITSYNLGGHANQIPTSYWVMMNSLDYASPKVVVIDCYSLASNLKVFDDFEYVHLSFDAFPLTVTKLKAVADLLFNPGNDNSAGVTGENGTKEKHTRIGLLWDYSVYHSRWSDITQRDFEPEISKEYGAEARIQIAEPSHMAENPGTTLKEMTVGRAYLELMIEECKSRGIEVLLTYIPYPVTGESTWIDINTVYEIAGQHDVKYLDYLALDVVDYETDCYDPASHLNPSGAFKVTDYMGRYLTENYDLSDHRGDAGYAYWDTDYDLYTGMKDERLAQCNDLNTYLMLLQDKRYGLMMEIEDREILEDETTLRLLKNKGADISKINDGTEYIFISDSECRISADPDGLSSDAGSDGNMDIREEDSDENGIIVNVFENGDEDHIIDTSVFAIHRTDYDAEGQTLRTSKATRNQGKNEKDNEGNINDQENRSEQKLQ